MNSFDKVMAVHQYLDKIDAAREELAGVLNRDTLIQRQMSAREHTQKWYASHYGKLEDWARKILPEPYRNQFFSCIANGTYSTLDRGEPYECKAGGMVVPSGYIHMNDTKGQLVLNQTQRAEEAELALEDMTRDRDEWKAKFESVKETAPNVYNAD